jgi:hypothetical protein
VKSTEAGFVPDVQRHPRLGVRHENDAKGTCRHAGTGPCSLCRRIRPESAVARAVRKNCDETCVAQSAERDSARPVPEESVNAARFVGLVFRMKERPRPGCTIQDVPSADVPSVKELREIGRRLCARIGVRPHEPIDAVALRRVFDERAHTTDAGGVMRALRACADALADHELAPEVLALRAALDAYESARKPVEATKKALADALKQAVPVLDEEADRRAKACEAVLTEEDRRAGVPAYIWPSPDSLRKFPRKMLELLDMEAYAVEWLHRIVRDLALVDAHQNVRTEFASPRVRMAKALYDDGYTPAQIATIIHPFATGKARTSARVAVAKRLALRSDEVVVEIGGRDKSVDGEALARAEGQFVLTGQIDGLRSHVTAPTDSIIAEEFPVEDRLRPKRPRRDRGRSTPSKRSRSTTK